MSPLKLGIRARPPALTLVYRNGAGKERYRVMPVRFLNKFGSVENVLKEMKEKHKDYLDNVIVLLQYQLIITKVSFLLYSFPSG